MLSMIACCSRNRVIGYNGQIPWRLPADLSFFKKKTWGSAVLMGRVTWESLKGYLFPGRDMIVVTSRHRSYHIDGVTFVSSPEDAVALVNDAKPMFIIGGSRLYTWGLLYASYLFLTEIHGDYKGDTFFPELTSDWQEYSREAGDASNFDYQFDFVCYRNYLPKPIVFRGR